MEIVNQLENNVGEQTNRKNVEKKMKKWKWSKSSLGQLGEIKSGNCSPHRRRKREIIEN